MAPRAPELRGSQKEHGTVVPAPAESPGPARSTDDPGASSGARAKTQRPDGGSEPGPIPQRRPLTRAVQAAWGALRGAASLGT